MAKAYSLYVGMVTALALCKYCLAEWNTTTTVTAVTVTAVPATDQPANRTEACRHHGNRSNCTADSKDTGQWSGHFSKCPKELRHYCIHGVCRYVKEQNAPSCRCERGFVGSRCEYVDLGPRIGEQREIIIACVIAGLVFLILLIVFICICVHRRHKLCRGKRRRRREERSNGEKISMMNTSSGTHEMSLDSAETSHTNTV